MPVRSGAAAPRCARHEAGVGEGELAGHHPELAEAVELARGLRGHPGERVEVVDLGRDLRAERRGIEPVDPLDRRAPGAQPGPERVDARADGRDGADAGDPDASTLGHVGGFVTGASRGLARGDGLGQRPERRQRATGDRLREPALDDRGEAGDPRGEVVIDGHVRAAAGGVRLDAPRDVHALRRAGDVDEPEPPGRRVVPRPGPPRDRQAEPQDRHERPARDEVDDAAPVGPRLDDARPRVVGEQVRPGRHVPGQAVDELRRGVDVDADRRMHGVSRRRWARHRAPARGGRARRGSAARASAGGEPGAAVRRAVDLVPPLAAGQPDPVEDPDRVHPVGTVDVVEQPVRDVHAGDSIAPS